MDNSSSDDRDASQHPTPRRLHANLLRFCDADMARDIAYGVPLSVSASDAEKAVWVRYAVSELERLFSPDTARSVMMGCHCEDVCRLGEMKTWLGGLFREASGFEDFVDRVNEHGAGWYFEDGWLYTKFLWCECHMLRVIERLPSMTWCHCTEGYTKALFEHVLGCGVESELVQSIKTGHDHCLVRIKVRR